MRPPESWKQGCATAKFGGVQAVKDLGEYRAVSVHDRKDTSKTVFKNQIEDMVLDSLFIEYNYFM